MGTGGAAFCENRCFPKRFADGQQALIRRDYYLVFIEPGQA